VKVEPAVHQDPLPSSLPPLSVSETILVEAAPPTEVPESSENDKVDLPIVAIPVYPEFDRLLSNQRPGRHSKEVVAMHAKLEREPRDAAWATEMEDALRKFYMGKPELRRYGVIPQVDCRTSTCEVRMLAFSADDFDLELTMEKPGSAPWPTGAVLLVADFDKRETATAFIIQVGFPKRPGFGPPPRELLK
jgi:hypothetical protein